MNKDEMAEAFEDLPILSQYGLWSYKNAVMMDALALALEAAHMVDNLEKARDALRKMYDSYALASPPLGMKK